MYTLIHFDRLLDPMPVIGPGRVEMSESNPAVSTSMCSAAQLSPAGSGASYRDCGACTPPGRSGPGPGPDSGGPPGLRRRQAPAGPGFAGH